MAGKRFKSTLNGYDKTEVDVYLKNVFDDFEMKLSEKDKEINKLLGQVKELSKKYDQIRVKEEAIDAEKKKITKALVRADETYAQIIDDAKKEASAEIEQLENQAETQREKIVDIKRELISMKETANAMVEEYKNAIDRINTEYEITIEEKPAAAIEESVDSAEDTKEEDSFVYYEYQITDDTEDIEDTDGE